MELIKKNKILLKILGIIVLLVMILFSLNYSTNTSLYPPFYTYEFRLYGLESLILRNFQIFYDFELQNGNLSFQIGRKNIPKQIEVELPDKVKIYGYNICNETVCLTLENEDFTYNHDSFDEKPSRLLLENFKHSLNNFNFNFKFKKHNDTLYPHGRFLFSIGAEILYYKKDVIGKWDKDTMVKFNLGDYECSFACMSELMTKRPEEGAEGQKIENIFRLYSTQEEGDPPFVRFVLNTYDTNIKRWVDIFTAIAVGLIVALITLIGYWVKDILNI